MSFFLLAGARESVSGNRRFDDYSPGRWRLMFGHVGVAFTVLAFASSLNLDFKVKQSREMVI